jgi:hypothetical protein
MAWNGERFYFPYTQWEDYKNGMWKKLTKDKEDDYLKKAVEFTGNDVLYGKWMMEAVKKWPITCLHNLSDVSQNRKAFIGHAAVCLALGCPEYITRMAWWELTTEQQDKANAQADAAILYWENSLNQDQLELWG